MQGATPGSEEKEGAGAGLGGWKAAPTPAPLTKEAVLPLCSLSLTARLAPFAVCTVDSRCGQSASQPPGSGAEGGLLGEGRGDSTGMGAREPVSTSVRTRGGGGGVEGEGVGRGGLSNGGGAGGRDQETVPSSCGRAFLFRAQGSGGSTTAALGAQAFSAVSQGGPRCP